MNAIAKREPTICPHCAGSGTICSYCSLPGCDEESMTAEHDALGEPVPCHICSGKGEVPAPLAAAYERRQAARLAIAPQPLDVVADMVVGRVTRAEVFKRRLERANRKAASQ